MKTQKAIDRLGQTFKKLITAVLDTTPSEATGDTQKRMRSITTLFSNFVTLAIYVFLLVWLFQLGAQIILTAVVPKLPHYDIHRWLQYLEYILIRFPGTASPLLKAIPIIIAAIAYAGAALLYSLRFFLAVSRFIRSYRVFTAFGILSVGYSLLKAFCALFNAKSPYDTAPLILKFLVNALK